MLFKIIMWGLADSDGKESACNADPLEKEMETHSSILA